VKQPERVLALAHHESEIKAPTVDSFILFQFYFTMGDGLKKTRRQWIFRRYV